MKKSSFIPGGNAQKGIWLSNFNNILTPALATKLGVSKDKKTALNADTQAFVYCLVLTAAAKGFEHQCVTFQLSMLSGVEGEVVMFPIMDVVGVAPSPVASGIFTRVRAIVKIIKISPFYTTDIGKALGIIGSDIESKQDEVMPILIGKVVAGNAQLKYTKGANDGIRIESKRGTETSFTFLDKANTSVYSDTRPNLIVGQAEKREYRSFFIKSDEIIGQVSAVISLAING